MMAYRIAMFLILFNLGLGVIGALGIFGVPTGAAVGGVPGWSLTNWDWKGILLSGIGIITLMGALVFHVPIGAAIFTIVFTVSVLPMSSTFHLLEEVGVMPEITGMIMAVLGFIYIFAFIELAGGGGGE